MTTRREWHRLRPLHIPLLCALLGVAGCRSTQPGEGPIVRALDDCESIEPWLGASEAPPGRLPGSDELRLSAAVHETIAFQLLVLPAGFSLGSLQVEVEPLVCGEHSIAESEWRIFAMEPVAPTDPPAWMLRRWPQPARRPTYADRLRPLDMLPRIPADRPQALWIELQVPFGTEPGQYQGRLTLRRGPKIAASLPIQMRVHPFAVPGDAPPLCLAPLRVAGASEKNPASARDSEKLGERIIAAAALLRRHHVEAWPCDVFPILRVDPQQRVTVEWSEYDRLVAPLLDGTCFDDPAPTRCWPLPVDARHPDPERFGGVESSVFGSIFGQYAAQCQAHFRERGWEKPAVLLLDTGPLSDAASYARFQRLAGLARQAAPGLKIVAPFSSLDLREFGWPTYAPFPAPDLIDIWSPPAQFFGAVGSDAQRWLSPGEPPYSGSLRIVAPPLDARTLGWQLHVARARALRLMPVTPQPAPERLAQSGAARVQDPLLYAASDDGALMPSVRLKRLRRGLLDAAYLDLLHRHGRGELADLLGRTLFKFGGADAYGDHFADGRPFGWVEDPDMWALGHDLLGEQIVRAVGGSSDLPAADAAYLHSLDWERLQAECRKVRLFVDGVRLAIVPGAAPTEVLATVSLTIVNETRHALSAALSCQAGDVSGTRMEAAQRTASVPPEGRINLRLPISLQALPVTDHGSIEIPLDLDGARTGRLGAAATLAYVVPVRLEAPLRLDGDLGDWPIASGNVAADFRLISGRPAGDTGDAGDRPTEPTQAYFAYDDEHLYVGVRCEEPQMDRLPVGLSNFVLYDGLTPVGEDYIEIVLDPTNAGTRDTGEVYHLLIKANGVVTSERGIGCDPPTGRHEPWPSNAAVQVKHLSEAWSAEVRLPLAALPADSHAHLIWALNVARYSALRLEYSNWAGAKRHVYSPLSMGNLVWPPGAPVSPR